MLHGISCFQLLIVFYSYLFLKLHIKVRIRFIVLNCSVVARFAKTVLMDTRSTPSSMFGGYYIHKSAKRVVLAAVHLFFKPGTCWQACVPGFLELLLSANVCMRACVCVCLPPRLLITSGMMWCDIDPI